MTNNFSNSTSHDQTKQQWTTGTESIFVFVKLEMNLMLTIKIFILTI